MWNILGFSAIGTSHIEAGTDCQDAHDIRLLNVGDSYGFAFAIADGAGSAKYSKEGALLAVQSLLDEIARPELDPRCVEDPVAQEFFHRIRQKLVALAEESGIRVRDLSCTLLGGFVSRESAWFAQVGDGACLYLSPEGYQLATIPTNGEFANQTTFLVSENWAEVFQFKSVSGPVDAVAGFTDGLQHLVIRFSDNSVHEGFLDPLLRALRSQEAEKLRDPFRSFLSSERINSRTDDDKTLMLACWRDTGSASEREEESTSATA
jgi:hypothetical protein